MRIKAVNMCLGCGRTVNTQKECYIFDDYGLYSHIECKGKIKGLIDLNLRMFDNRKKEWKNR